MVKSESEKDMRQKNENLNKTVQEQDVAERNQAYNEYVKQVTPTHNLALKMLKAFVTGGIICCIGQVILNIAQNAGLDKDTSGGWCSMILVLMSVILTGLNIYPSIAKFGGAGALVPITGFANSVAVSYTHLRALLPSNSKRKVRFLGLAAKFLPLRVR